MKIGIIKNSALIPRLREMGFRNILEVGTANQNAKMLQIGRVVAIVESMFVDTYEWSKAGFDTSTLSFTNIGDELHIYIAGNRNFPPPM